jgi:hypothetical protein
MNPKLTFFGLPLPHLVSLGSFAIVVISIWIHLEIRIAEINVELANLKQDMIFHKSENRRDFEVIHSDFNTGTTEVLKRIDEIQIYLRNRR